MPKPSSEPLTIGVDGGATEVKAHEVVVLERGQKPLLALGSASAGILYDRVDGFEPVALDEQLRARAAGDVELRPSEHEAADAWIDAAARAIASVVEQAGPRRARVGMCMPGLKTADGRGLAVVRNGPRNPRFLDQLEQELARRDVVLSAPIAGLASDADACGLGEDLALDGAFRNVEHALYIGGGTGLAEVAKLGGRVVGFDELEGVVEKGWRLVSETGATFEERLSMRAVNARFAQALGLALPLADADLPEERAQEGDPAAIEALGDVADALAELASHRIRSLASRGLAQRVVVGQRLGVLFANPSLKHVLHDRAEAALALRLATADASVRAALLDSQQALFAGFLSASTLREAPAIGAASLALRVAERAKGARRGR